MTRHTNIAQSLTHAARDNPFKRAVVYPESRDRYGRVLYSQMTFEQLDRHTDSLAAGLDSIGIGRGTRTILMVSPGMAFFLTVFAMFKVGAVPVVVDPGMGIDRMLQCLAQSRPTAFIGIEKAHLLRTLRPGAFRTVKRWVTVGRKWFWGGHTLDDLMDRFPGVPFKRVQTTADETAAIVFTTGSTGPAKGVIYTHGNFEAQIRQIQSHFEIGPDEIDLPTFPLFALFDPALGMTAVIPDMDPTKPALVNPVKIIEAIENHGVTNMFASPALLNRVGKYGMEKNIKLPSLRRVVSAGAPVSPANIEQFSSMLSDNTQIHTPYGATEAVPVISIGSHEILSETRKFSEQGFGMCVGRPIAGTQVKLIEISDGSVSIQDLVEVPEHEVGEITVKADLVTAHYFNDPNADRLAKIRDRDGGIWHRMGDLGWKDSKGRIWFCGRKAHRVETGKQTLFTIPVEAIFNNHEQVYRSALTGIGPKNHQIPVVFVEPFQKILNEKQLIHELFNLARKSPLTADIEYILIDYKFPVDIRHNSKIFREKLAVKARELIVQGIRG